MAPRFCRFALLLSAGTQLCTVSAYASWCQHVASVCEVCRSCLCCSVTMYVISFLEHEYHIAAPQHKHSRASRGGSTS
jgi:hypothetical protein